MKKCNRCGQEKPLDEFKPYFVSRKRGKRRPYCYDCDAAYQRAYHAERVRKAKEAAGGLVCFKCKTKKPFDAFPPSAPNLHHAHRICHECRETQVCIRCGEDKPIGQFYANGPYHRPECKECTSYEQKRQKEAPRARARVLAACLKRYGVALEDYERMLAEQGGVCAICGRPETATYRGVTKRLSVDHDHETDAIRGLLCLECNRGLGAFRDSPALLLAAIEYLRRRGET